MSSSVTLGKDFKLYIDTDDPYDSSPTWAEVTNIKDVTENGDFTLADCSVRASNFQLQEPTLFNYSIDFQMQHDPGDALLTQIKAAAFARTELTFAVLDGPIATNGTKGVVFRGKVTKFTGNQPLTDSGTHDVSIAPCFDLDNLPHLVTVAGGVLTNDTP